MRMIRSCVCLITIELRNEEKHFNQTNNRPIVFLQLFLATQTFFIFALLTNIEHH